MESIQSKNNYLTVSALTQYLKRKFEVDPYLQKVTVIGEISNFNSKASKHRYFSLKDEQSKINVVMFKSAFDKLVFQPEEGMKVIVTGRVSLYGPSGSYQITIDTMQPDGVGALYQAFEQLKRKLGAEGVFDKKQQTLPKYPERIAVITSPSGAVIRDIITTIKRRYPIVKVVVYPVRVQGQESADEIVDAFNQIKQSENHFDTIILARGGGSIEDLWSFNEERVARAIYECDIPVISSIGHETDTTIADYVADLRAPTPTAAAEMSVPVLIDVMQTIQQNKQRIYFATSQLINLYRKQLNRNIESYVLKEPQRLYQPYSQRIDELNRTMLNNFIRILDKQTMKLTQNKQRLMLKNPIKMIEEKDKQQQQATERLIYLMQHQLQNSQQDLKRLITVLDALSPLKILTRGYSVIESEGVVVRSVEQLNPKDKIEIKLTDGTASAQVIKIVKESQNGN